MPCVQLGYRETKGLQHLLWIRLCRAIDIHIIWVVIMSCIMWTYRVTHIEWAENQPLGLKLVFKPKGSICGFIHSFFTLERGG